MPVSARAVAPAPPHAPAPARPHLQAQSHLLIITGLSGEPRFATQFDQWARDLMRAAEQRHGVPRANITWLAEKDGVQGAAGRATKASVEQTLLALGRRARPGDVVFIVLLGHGSERGDDASINLSGPDLEAGAFAVMLNALAQQQVVVVNTASASGGFVAPLAGANRVVVTSTKSVMEKNETLFAGPFVRAFAEDVADVDKDGRTSLLEAFEYARLETERAYASTNRLQTEHAVLDANGDGEPITTAAGPGPDVAAASAIFLGTARSATAAAAPPANASPALRALYDERARTEAAIDALRARKDAMPAAEYDRELERLLVQLATTNQSIRRLEAGS